MSDSTATAPKNAWCALVAAPGPGPAVTALAPADAPYSVVDVARQPWIHHQPAPKGKKMTPQEFLRAQAEMIAAVGDRDLRPTPGGAAARATAEHFAAAGLKSRHDAADYADRIAGHEAAAKALTDAALCEREQNVPGAQ
jgi:hypothetical protein